MDKVKINLKSIPIILKCTFVSVAALFINKNIMKTLKRVVSEIDHCLYRRPASCPSNKSKYTRVHCFVHTPYTFNLGIKWSCGIQSNDVSSGMILVTIPNIG